MADDVMPRAGSAKNDAVFLLLPVTAVRFTGSPREEVGPLTGRAPAPHALLRQVGQSDPVLRCIRRTSIIIKNSTSKRGDLYLNGKSDFCYISGEGITFSLYAGTVEEVGVLLAGFYGN